jgi:hypothetical protein
LRYTQQHLHVENFRMCVASCTTSVCGLELKLLVYEAFS